MFLQFLYGNEREDKDVTYKTEVLTECLGKDHFKDCLRLVSPIDGSDEMHIISVKAIHGRDNYEAGWEGRQDLVTVNIEDESGGKWDLCIGEHKGNIKIFVRKPVEGVDNNV